MIFKPFQKAIPLLQTLHLHGYEAFFVGGAVRDGIIGRPVHDIDIATSAKPDEVIRLFPETVPIGIEHGTVLVHFNHSSYEVTTFRTESDYEDFRHPTHVHFDSSLEEDLKRRDFTMNAIALSIDGQVIDPFQGQNDIADQVIRTVGIARERFQEDPLRMLRAVRFVSQLSFKLDPTLEEGIAQSAALIQHISMERVEQEMDKLLMGKNVTNGIQSLINTGLYKFLPLFSKGDGLQRIIDMEINKLQTLIERWVLIITMLDIGQNELSTFFKTWKFSNQKSDKIKQVFKFCRIMREQEWSNRALYEMGVEVASSVARLLSVYEKTALYPRVEELEAKYLSLPIKKRQDLACRGTDLIQWTGKQPGPWINETFQVLENAVLQGKLLNQKKEIKKWVMK